MEFKVTYLVNEDLPQRVIPKVTKTHLEINARKIPKHEQLGIKISRRMMHPTCTFCGLEDRGKDAIERPTEKHMLSCEKRELGPKPVDRINGVAFPRRGSFIGHGSGDSMRYPVRQMIPFPEPELDPATGDPTGEMIDRWSASYRWKTSEVNNWVWNGNDWVTCHEWRKSRN